MVARSGQPGRTAPIAADRILTGLRGVAQPRSMVWFSWPCGRVGRAAGAAQIQAPRSTATSASASPCPSYTAALDMSGEVGRLVRLAGGSLHTPRRFRLSLVRPLPLSKGTHPKSRYSSTPWHPRWV